MSYLWPAGLAQHDGHNVKAKGTVLDMMCGEKITGGPKKFCPLGICDGLLGWAKTLIGFGSYLDKNDRAISIDHHQVDLTGLAGKVAGERFQTFTLEKLLSSFFAPSAKQFPIGQ